MNSWINEFGDSFSGKRVVVTGVNGFIGGHLRDALIALDAKVYGLDRAGFMNANIPGCQTRTVDLTDLDAIKVVISEIRPNIIYHLASMVTARQDVDLVLPMLQNNLLGTVNLLLAATELDCERLVAVGSAEEPEDGVPNSPYAASKSAAMMYAKMFFQIYALPVVTARLFMTYGPRQQADKLIPYSILSLLQDQIPNLDSGERVVDFVYIMDIIRGLLLAGIRPAVDGKVFEFGSGTGIKIKDAVALLAEMMGNVVQPKVGVQTNRLGEKHFIADPDVAWKSLGWKPLWSLQNGLKETVAWYQAGAELKPR